MNEERFGYRIRQALNHGARDVPLTATRRLEAARHLALSKQKQPLASLSLAGAVNGKSSTLNESSAPPVLRQTLAIAALLLGMWIAFYWHSVQYVSEIENVDSALLSDDLPFDAFLDDDLIEWLKDDSAE